MSRAPKKKTTRKKKSACDGHCRPAGLSLSARPVFFFPSGELAQRSYLTSPLECREREREMRNHNGAAVERRFRSFYLFQRGKKKNGIKNKSRRRRGETKIVKKRRRRREEDESYFYDDCVKLSAVFRCYLIF